MSKRIYKGNAVYTNRNTLQNTTAKLSIRFLNGLIIFAGMVGFVLSTSGAYANVPSGSNQFGEPFTVSEVFPVFPSNEAIANNPVVVDVNNDGKQDVLTLETASGSIRTFIRTRLGIGNGAVGTTKSTTTSWASSFQVLDVNADGTKDLMTIAGAGNPTNGNLGMFEVRLGNNDGTFTETPQQSITTPGGFPGPSGARMHTKDVNSDGFMDVVASYHNTLGSDLGDKSVAITYLNDGNGRFSAKPEVLLDIPELQTVVAVEDFNEDGRVDLLVGNNNDVGAIWVGDGTGSFTKSPSQGISGVGVFSNNWAKPVVADYNGDGKQDIAVMHNFNSSGADALRVYLNLGNGVFDVRTSINSVRETLAGTLASADVNNDGQADILGTSGNGAVVYLGDGTGRFTRVQDVIVPRGFAMALGDLNGDRSVDLVFSAQVSSPNPSRLVASLNLNPPADTTSPSVTGFVSRQFNENGWYNQDLTINWQATDPAPSSGAPAQPAPTLANVEGRNVSYTSGQSCDTAYNCATGSYTVSLDKTAPTLGTVIWSTNPKTIAASSNLTVPASDALSGISEGEYFIGNDPGQGNGATLTRSGATFTTTFGTNFVPGVYGIGLRANDVAGNWSATTKTMLVVFDPAGPGVTGKNKKDLVPSLARGDVLPGLTGANQTDVADYGFSVGYRNGVLDSRNDFQFAYSTGSRCNTPNPDNCHNLVLNATSFEWLTVDQANDSRAQFRGLATTIIDGVTTRNPFTISATDGNRTNPASDDRLTLNIYAPNADPATAQPIYIVSGVVTRNNGVSIR